MGNIHVMLYEIWTTDKGGDVVLKQAYGRRTKTNHNSSP